MADWMIANPGGSLYDLAKHVHKSYQTVCYVLATDMFKDFLSQRKEEFRARHDHAIIHKTTAVAEKALDLMLEKMEKQGDKLQITKVTEIATSALDRLGYGPKSGPAVEVRVDNSDNRKIVMVPISAGALEEARDALRQVEQQKAVAQREAQETVEIASEARTSSVLGAESKDSTVVEPEAENVDCLTDIPS
jgi:hypothetical protein